MDFNVTNSSLLNATSVSHNIYAYYNDNFEGLSSMETHMVGTIIHRIILPAICACGILGIILTVIVLSHKNMYTSTNCYLMALSFADLIFLLIMATTLVDNQFVPDSKAYYRYVIYVTYSAIFMHIFLLASIWLTVMLAVERFIAICRPFLANKMCTVGKARIIVLIIYAVALICRLPNFWENRVVTLYDPITNSTLSYMEVTDFSTNEHYITLYPWIIDVFLTSMIPCLLLIILNVKLIWEVKKSTQYLQRNLVIRANGTSSVAQKEDLQITIMLISVIMVFFICQAPYVIYTAIVSINKFAAHSSGFMVFRYVTMLLLTLKSAVNFILYCWFSEKFLATTIYGNEL